MHPRTSLLSLLGLSLLSGCASNALDNEQQAALLQQQASKKTLEISCDGPCKLSYQDPRDRLQLPRHTNGWDVANTVVNTAGSVALGTAPWAAVSKIAADGYDRAGGTYTNSHNQDSTHTPTVVNAPDPLVVNQPDPIIIPPPAPVIVTQPEPVIVTP